MTKAVNVCVDATCTEVIIVVGHQLKTDQLARLPPISLFSLTLVKIREERLYIVVLTCVVGVADKRECINSGMDNWTGILEWTIGIGFWVV